MRELIDWEKSKLLTETADERTDVSGRTGYTTLYKSEAIVLPRQQTHCTTVVTKEYLHLEQ